MKFRIARALAVAFIAPVACAAAPAFPTVGAPAASESFEFAKSAKPPQPPETVLLENGAEHVTVRDLDAAMTRFPKELREEARAYPSVIMRNVDAIFVNRVLSDRARAAGVDQNALVKLRLRQVQEAHLAQAYLDRLFDQVKVPDLSVRAEEIYKAEPKRFTEPESVGLLHIFVGLQGRTPEMALAKAREAEQRLKAGEDFVAVATTYSDDPRIKENQANLGVVPLNALEPELRDAITPLKPGDTTPALLSRSGAHILRLTQRHPLRVRPFAEVKDDLIGEESNKYRRHAVDEIIAAIRNDPKNTIYKDRVDATRSEIDTKKIEKAHMDSIERIQAGSQ
jgi:parvulin-like peptidyl-prolyl isomerase